MTKTKKICIECGRGCKKDSTYCRECLSLFKEIREWQEGKIDFDKNGRKFYRRK